MVEQKSQLIFLERQTIRENKMGTKHRTGIYFGVFISNSPFWVRLETFPFVLFSFPVSLIFENSDSGNSLGEIENCSHCKSSFFGFCFHCTIGKETVLSRKISEWNTAGNGLVPTANWNFWNHDMKKYYFPSDISLRRSKVSNAVCLIVFDIVVCLGLPWFQQTAIIKPDGLVNFLGDPKIPLGSPSPPAPYSQRSSSLPLTWTVENWTASLAAAWWWGIYFVFQISGFLYKLYVFDFMHPPVLNVLACILKWEVSE